MKKIFIFIFCLFAFGANAMEKKTTFDKELFNKAQSEGKIVVVSSWIKYCSSCANQMKVLQKAKKDGELSGIKFFFLNCVIINPEVIIKNAPINVF